MGLQLRLKFVRHVIMSNSRENSDWSGSKNGSEERKERQESGDGVTGMDPGGVIESNWDKVCDSFDKIRIFVLDEADEMLSRGFKDQIYDVFKNLPAQVQVNLLSATMPDEVMEVTN